MKEQFPAFNQKILEVNQGADMVSVPYFPDFHCVGADGFRGWRNLCYKGGDGACYLLLQRQHP